MFDAAFNPWHKLTVVDDRGRRIVCAALLPNSQHLGHEYWGFEVDVRNRLLYNMDPYSLPTPLFRSFCPSNNSSIEAPYSKVIRNSQQAQPIGRQLGLLDLSPAIISTAERDALRWSTVDDLCRMTALAVLSAAFNTRLIGSKVRDEADFEMLGNQLDNPALNVSFSEEWRNAWRLRSLQHNWGEILDITARLAAWRVRRQVKEVFDHARTHSA